MLEPHEVARLQKGKTLMITTQAGDEIGLQFMAAGGGELKCDACGATETLKGKPFTDSSMIARHKKRSHKTKRAAVVPMLRCKECGATTTATGKPFRTAFAVMRHVMKKHGGKAVRRARQA